MSSIIVCPQANSDEATYHSSLCSKKANSSDIIDVKRFFQIGSRSFKYMYTRNASCYPYSEIAIT